MKKIENLKSKTAEKVIKDLIDKSVVVQTDKSSTYSNFADFIDVHVSDVSKTKECKFNLQWVHIAISNLKGDLRKFRMISQKYI